MMQVPGCGAFVRALLPISLDDGAVVTYGVWLAVPPDTLQSAFAVWWSPDYPSLRLEGYLANELPPGGVLLAPAVAVVRDEQETPYVQHSSHPLLARLLHETQSAADFT